MNNRRVMNRDNLTGSGHNPICAPLHENLILMLAPKRVLIVSDDPVMEPVLMLQQSKHLSISAWVRAARPLARALMIFLLLAQLGPSVAQAQVTASQNASLNDVATDAGRQSAPSDAADKEDSFLSRLFGSQTDRGTTRESWPWRIARSAFSFLLATLLAAGLAFRPRRGFPVLQRNPYVAETQILIAVVGAAMMIVVADSVARAFGIFAAASLVRFRTNIRDPKEITVLLVSLCIGIAAGVGRPEISITLALFVMLTLWVLERYETALVFRAMELKVKTRHVEETDEILKGVFKKHGINAEMRKIDREDDDHRLGTILYYVSVSPAISTDLLSDEIFSTDSNNIDSIEWDQKKSRSYIYR
jgi:uncharacterized membrane protein YhiD involved in acid resistance